MIVAATSPEERAAALDAVLARFAADGWWIEDRGDCQATIVKGGRLGNLFCYESRRCVVWVDEDARVFQRWLGPRASFSPGS